MAHKKPDQQIVSPKEALGDMILPVSRLHLDPKNPRHNPLEADSEVIAQLCNAELIAELAHDIANRGALSPLDVLGVIPYEGHPGHFIAVEGNRRTCALLLLLDPSRAPTQELRSQLQRLSKTTNVPTEVKVYVFADRASAKPWIDLRHLGPQGGRGTREWNADQKTRAAGNNPNTSSKANKLALEVLDRLVRTGLLTQEQRGKVSLTTITRYLGTPGVRALLGLGSPSRLIYTHDASEVDVALLRLVTDSIYKQDDDSFLVNSRASSEERLTYATKLKSKNIAPSTPMDAPAPPEPAPQELAPPGPALPEPATDAKSAADKKIDPEKKKRTPRNPAQIPTLFDSGFTVPCKDPVLLRLRTEALSMKLDDFPFAANYLLRAFVEQTMILFAKKRGKFNSGMNDQKLTQTCADELNALGVTGRALTVISKAAGSRDQPYSLHSLGHAVHGGSIPTRQQLRALFDTWEPSLRAMLDQL